jgi:3-dehydroquinate dehydratase-2
MARFLILNGPNLNMLGRRDAGFYGVKTLEEINGEIVAVAARLGVEVEFFQSNHEGALVDCIQEARDRIDGLIVNGGALTHYGLTLKDALIDCRLPFVEVHLSNPLARDAWRRHSVLSDIARGQIAGFGWRSYTAALEILAALVEEESQ